MFKKLRKGIKVPSRDITIDGHGSIFIVIPHTKAARELLSEKIQEDAQGWGGGIAVEHRYIVDIAQMLRDEGMRVNT